MATFTPNPNITRGPTQASGSTHQFTGSVEITGSLTLNGSAITGGGGGGSGDVSGPGSATDNAIVRFNGTGGKTIQNSSVTIDDSNNLGNATTLSASDGMSAGAVVTDGLATLAAVKVTAGPIWFHTGATHQIQNSNGDSNITLDTGDGDVTIGGDLQVNGNDIKDSGGNAQFTFEDGVGFTSGKATVMGGTFTTSLSGSTTLSVGGAATIGGNTTLGNAASDYHQVSGTLSISGSQPLIVYGPTGAYTGAPSIIARSTASVGESNMWEQPASGALIVSADPWDDQPNGAVMYVHSPNAAAIVGFKNSSTLVSGIQKNAVTSNAVKGAFIGLQNTDMRVRNHIGNVVLTADGSTEITVSNDGTTIGNSASDYHQVSGTLDVSGTLKATNGIDPEGSAADSIQIGNNNGAVAIGSLNISFGGTVLGQGSQAIGPGSPVANQAGASAIGSGSHSTGANALAVGTTSVASAAAAVALGSSATGSAANAIAVGTTTKATAAGATALGNAATSSAAGAIAIGSGATTAGAYSVVLGDTITHVTHNHTTVIGSRADVGGVNAVAIGSGSNAGAANAIAIGEAAAPTAANTVAVGKSATSSGTGSVVIGAGASTTGQQSVALGPVNTTTANYTTVVGYNNNASVNYSIVIGNTSVGSAANAIAVGQNVSASGADAIALGQFATASAANTIAMGSGSNAARANTAVFGNSTVPMRLYVSGGFAQTNFYHGAAHVNGSQQLAAGTYNIFDVRYSGAMQLTASNLVAGASYLIFLSNSVGAAAVTYDPTTFKFPGGTVPTVTQTQGRIDIVSGISDGTTIYCDMTKDFS